MISVISGIATMRSSEEANKMQVQNFLEFQECFFRQSLNEKELVLIEQRKVGATESAFDGLIDPRAVHEVVYNDRFNSPWVLNIGAKYAYGDILAFIDADVVFGDDYLQAVVDAMGKSDHPYLHGFDTSYWWSDAGRQMYLDEESHDLQRVMLEQYTREELVNRVVIPTPHGNVGLSVICLKDFYFDVVGGHNESIIQGGGRDNDFAWRVVDKAGEFPLLDYNLCHLWHGGKILGEHNGDIWRFTMKHPGLVTDEIKRLGVGDVTGPKNHTIEEWESLAEGKNG